MKKIEKEYKKERLMYDHYRLKFEKHEKKKNLANNNPKRMEKY